MDKLRFIKEQMEILEVPYEYGEWTEEITYPYFTGEIIESPYTTEDGFHGSSLKITGWHRGYMVELERYKNKIEQHFHPITGCTQKMDNSTIAGFYESAFYIPSGDADLKKIEISIELKEWRGDL